MTGQSPTTRAPGAPASTAPDDVPPDEVDLIAAAVLGCPAVVRLHGGELLHQVTTYLPGRRVAGVRVDEHAVEVSVVSVWGVPAPQVAAQVRSAVGALAGGRDVHVHVADVVAPGDEALGAPQAEGSTPRRVDVSEPA